MRSLTFGFLVATVVLFLPGGARLLGTLGSAAHRVLPSTSVAALCILGAVVGVAVGMAVNRHRDA